jgi:hypothetical protein
VSLLFFYLNNENILMNKHDNTLSGVKIMDFITDFSPYVGLAVILYAIRQTDRMSNKYIPIVAVVLGVLYSFWDSGGASPGATLEGLKYALLGIGTVAGVKYSIESKSKK